MVSEASDRPGGTRQHRRRPHRRSRCDVVPGAHARQDRRRGVSGPARHVGDRRQPRSRSHRRRWRTSARVARIRHRDAVSPRQWPTCRDRCRTDSVLDALAARIARVQGVARLIRPADLPRADTASDPVARRWLHQLAPDAGVVLTVTLQPGSVWDYPNLLIAMHGQPSEDDSHVPIILWGRGVRRGSYPGRMNTVDIAPTLSVLLGVSPLSIVDGHARIEALGPRN